jgi:hypothetical protein
MFHASGSFCVTKPDGKLFKIVESESGLYYLDTTKNTNAEGVVMLTTISEKRNNCTNEEYLGAVLS